MISLERKKKGSPVIGTLAKGRDGGEEEGSSLFALQISNRTLDGGRMGVSVEILDATEAEEGEENKDAREAANYVGQKGEATAAMVMQHFRIGETAARDRLKTAAAEGWIKKTGKVGHADRWIPAYDPFGEREKVA